MTEISKSNTTENKDNNDRNYTNVDLHNRMNIKDQRCRNNNKKLGDCKITLMTITVPLKSSNTTLK